MQSGEDAQALRKILDFIRLGSVLLLLIHFYSVCHPAFQSWKLQAGAVDKIIYNLTQHVPLMNGNIKPKLLVLLPLIVSLVGTKGRKNEKLNAKSIIYNIAIGLLLFFISNILLLLEMNEATVAVFYISVTSIGYLLILSGGAKVSRLLHTKLSGDIFNDYNESFPQEERKIENEYTVNLPTEYTYRGKIRKGWINLQIFRGCLLSGTPGAGKSFWVVRNFITQLTAKQFCFFLYDYKYPDLTRILYNHYLRNVDKYPVKPNFYVINFDDLSKSHRCNVLYPETMLDLTDATESSRTLMLSLNKDWIKKSGDFFVESSINFVTALFWFLRQYEGGKYCSLPHAIELAQVDYNELFPVLSLEDSISVLINPFISAFLRNAAEQLEGQIASAKIGLARLSSPSLYWVLSGSDFTLDINNPEHPKYVAVGNNPAKQATYGAVLSLYVERLHKLINKKNQLPCTLIYDEYPTIFASVDLISVGRSNKISVLVGVQDMSQLVRDYGKEQAEVIVNICGNIISGQVLGESAKSISERIGKINQERESLSINSSDTSLSKSTQLDNALPISRISNLSSGEFVGTVADTPQQPVKNKAFYCRIINDIEAIRQEEAAYKDIPKIRDIDQGTVIANYYQIKKDIKSIIETEMKKIKSTPEFNEITKKNTKPKRSSVSR
ncbi:MAG: conjugal transfer protein TraG [Chitinophagaceae bacterium]|nr:MAG: conjugal transfer protein TraG [Chitinophagaceae bacterium]